MAGPRSASAGSVGCLGMGVLLYQDHKPLLLRNTMQKEVHLELGNKEEVH